MFRCCLASSMFALILISVAFTGDTKSDDAKNIQGTWKVVSLEPKDSSEDLSKVRIRIAKNEIAFVINGKDSEGYTYRLNPAKTPKEIDLTTGIYTFEKSKGKTKVGEQLVPGIYQLSGDDLVICIPSSKPTDKKVEPETLKRPREFKAGEHTGIMRLKRDK